MTKVIDKNEARAPFFGDKMSFVTGLDPLGLQNPSTQAYSYLLPGLNNVTGRIRNYSFYCWLLTEYAKQIKSADPQEQKKFIRRAEYIIALVAVEADIPGISGSLYATNRFKEGIETFDLNKGTYNADGSTINTYWQYSSGIFGQYYVGSLRQIGLIEELVNEKGEPMGIYRRTAKRNILKVSGEELAEAFDKNVSVPNKQLFFHCMKQGSIDHDQLEQLAQDFNLSQIKPDSEEAQLLIKLLIDVDEPSVVKESPVCMRKETLVHVLRYVSTYNNPIDARAFTMYAYDKKGYFNNSADACLSGWYFYQFNEYWQVACTAIFNGLLDYLYESEGPGWMSLHALILKASNAIVELLIGRELIQNIETSIASLQAENLGSERGLYQEITSSRKVDRMTSGFQLIWKLYEQNKESLYWLRDYTKTREIGGGNDVISFYLEYDKHLHYTIKRFIEDFLLRRIVQRHQKVAYRKMGGGSQSTQKFIIEDNYIRGIGNFEPGFTGPRVGNLISFLHDLNLLDGSKHLTESGELVLIEHS